MAFYLKYNQHIVKTQPFNISQLGNFRTSSNYGKGLRILSNMYDLCIAKALFCDDFFKKEKLIEFRDFAFPEKPFVRFFIKLDEEKMKENIGSRTPVFKIGDVLSRFMDFQETLLNVYENDEKSFIVDLKEGDSYADVGKSCFKKVFKLLENA